MAVDFSDPIPSKPQANGLSFDDLIPKQTGMSAYRETGTEPPDLSSKNSTPPYVEPGTEAPDLSGGTHATDTALGKIANAAAQGWKDTPSILAQPAQDFLDQSSVGHQIINPAFKVASAVPAGANALMQALAETANQITGDPRVGRDVMAALQILPIMGGARPPNLSAAALARIPVSRRPQYIAEHTAPNVSELDPRNAISSLIQHDIAENPVLRRDSGRANQSVEAAGDKVMQAPDLDGAIAAARDASGVGAATADIGELSRQPAAPETIAGAAQSVGAAATPGTLTNMSFSDMKANRRVAEQGELLAPPETRDNTVYVKGSFPTLAERSGDPAISQVENLIRQRNSGAFIGDGKILTENNKARIAEFEDQTVPDTTLNSMRKDRQTQWVAASNDILPNAKLGDLTEAGNWAEDQLNNPRIQENDAVRRVLEDFQSRLYDDSGKLKEDPAAIWGMHDHLQNMLAKAKDPLNMTGAEKFAEAQILEAKSLVDKALNVATDNRFQGALDAYAEASKAINSGVLMNDFRPKLTNMSGEVQAANFHRWALGLAKERGDPGIDPTMDISDKTMQSIINIDKDLKRAGLIKLGAAAGSPTNLLGALAESTGLDAAHSVLGAVPGIGPILKAGAGMLGQMKLERLTKQHLAPPEGGYVYPAP